MPQQNMNTPTENYEPAKVNESPKLVWQISLPIICIGIIAYGYIYSKNTTNNLGYLIGYYLPLSLIIWAIFHVAIGRPYAKRFAGFSFLAIYTSFIASGLIGYSQQENAAIQAISEIKESYSSISKELNSKNQALPQRIDTKIEVSSKARGDFGEIEKYIKGLMNKGIALRNDYILEIGAIGWNKILDPERVKADKTFAESRVIIQKAKEVIKKYRSLHHDLIENVKREMTSLKISEANREGILKGFDNGVTEAKKNIDTHWDLEEQCLLEIEKIFDLLSAKRGYWIVKDKNIVFSSNEDLIQYKQHINKIQSIIKIQQNIQQQQQNNVNNDLNNLMR